MKRVQLYAVEVEETAKFTYVVASTNPALAKQQALEAHTKGSPIGTVSGRRAGKCVCLGSPPRRQRAT